MDAAQLGAGALVPGSRPREPRAMLAWILTLQLLPVLGLILYVLLGDPRFERTRRP